MRADLPGAELVEQGLADLAERRESVPALLVSVGAPRLREAGFEIPWAFDEPEHRLYEALARTEGKAAHSRYNALVRRLVSFERAVACVR
jgi:hypothetical protein